MTREKKAMPAPRDLLVRASERGTEESMRHPLNPRSEIHGFMLGRRVGLERIGVSWIRIPPGKESFEPHVHHTEEEFLFVLSGAGVALVGDEVLEIGPGDFLGFPPGTLAHHVKNTGREDLVYLSCGENVNVEVADFPRLAKRLVRIGTKATVYPIALGESFLEAQSESSARANLLRVTVARKQQTGASAQAHQSADRVPAMRTVVVTG